MSKLIWVPPRKQHIDMTSLKPHQVPKLTDLSAHAEIPHLQHIVLLQCNDLIFEQQQFLDWRIGMESSQFNCVMDWVLRFRLFLLDYNDRSLGLLGWFSYALEIVPCSCLGVRKFSQLFSVEDLALVLPSWSFEFTIVNIGIVSKMVRRIVQLSLILRLRSENIWLLRVIS
jgi:hypothetical protein